MPLRKSRVTLHDRLKIINEALRPAAGLMIIRVRRIDIKSAYRFTAIGFDELCDAEMIRRCGIEMDRQIVVEQAERVLQQ